MSASGLKRTRVQSAFGTPQEVGGLVADVVAQRGHRQPAQPRRGQARSLLQEGRREGVAGFARTELPLPHDRHEHRRLGTGQRQQVGIDPRGRSR